MKLLRLFAAACAVAALTGVAYLAREQAPLGSQMADAAEKFLDTLAADQRTKAALAFDDKDRTNWQFVPLQDKDKKPTRKGVRFQELSEAQKAAALDLLKTGTSASGYKQAVTIMSLESIIHELEKGGAMVRDPGWYFVTVFGKPAKTGSWGWRIEGHHLSLNFTVENGRVSSATPAFFGANPAEVKAGERKGLRTLPDGEDLALELFNTLDDGQKKAALQSKHFGEPKSGVAAEPAGEPVGLAAAKMTDKQKETLMKLLQGYADRMPESVGAAQMKTVKDAGIDKIHFACSGAAERGQGHTYRVQGPTFVVQFLNVQADSAKNPANHIHSVWRELPSDFGEAAARR